MEYVDGEARYSGSQEWVATSVLAYFCFIINKIF